MKLTEKEALLLSNLYDSEVYRVFKKHFIEGRQMELAQVAPFLKDMDLVIETRGKIIELRNIEKELKANKDKQTKKEKS